MCFFLSFSAQALSQNRKSNTRLKPETFDLNLELGYFACQVNESSEYLQIFDISKLCDGHADCFMASDESQEKNKCTREYRIILSQKMNVQIVDLFT